MVCLRSGLREPWSTGDVDSRAGAASFDVLVVDGANVVGSRPDGWWKDRPGAAARLYDRLLGTPGLAPRVVLVLEGRSRAGVLEGVTGAVESPPTQRSNVDASVTQSRVAALQ